MTIIVIVVALILFAIGVAFPPIFALYIWLVLIWNSFANSAKVCEEIKKLPEAEQRIEKIRFLKSTWTHCK